MPISESIRTVFIHIPKTGGTTIEMMLDIYIPWATQRMDILRGPYDQNGEELRLQHLSLDEISAFSELDFSDWYKFTFVRNPWDRLVSHFFFKFRKRKNKPVGKKAFHEYIEWVEHIVLSRKGQLNSQKNLSN